MRAAQDRDHQPHELRAHAAPGVAPSEAPGTAR